MRRTIPLLVTAMSGFALIVSFFVPAWEALGDTVAIWFDILASIAFVLGGGNLLKMHLKKIADQARGWGYSAVTLATFLVMLAFGLFKIGAPPVPLQEFFGESFASLEIDDLPDAMTFTIAGTIPPHPTDDPLPASVRNVMFQQDEQIVFRGWMLEGQRDDLINYAPYLEWRCTVEKLFELAQPPESLGGKAKYYPDHDALSFRGRMSPENERELVDLGDSETWRQAVSSLAEISRSVAEVDAEMPEGVEIPESLNEDVKYDPQTDRLSIVGPMSPAQRSALSNQFPIARPAGPEDREALRREIESLGPLGETQVEALNKSLDAVWNVDALVKLLNEAGIPEEVEKSYCELREEQSAGVSPLVRTRTVGEPISLNEAQVDAVRGFANDETMTLQQLIADLRQAGDFNNNQAAVLTSFLSRAPTVGSQRRDLAFALLREGPLNREQLDYLLNQFRTEHAWKAAVMNLYLAAHQVKYPWSGQYRASGSPFWWMYEYAFKPLTATMFAVLAFYVASAAFRAFRAKNLEAMLLLGTAFIILMGRTFAGVYLTDWLPVDSPLRIENMTFYIMQIFTTAGNRAIMIGIALGIASTSLKVLLGIDRSYLGSSED